MTSLWLAGTRGWGPMIASSLRGGRVTQGASPQTSTAALGQRQNLRILPGVWNVSCGYSKSAEDQLGIDKPKRPLSAYVKFVNQLRPSLVAKNPDANSKDIMKLASKHWQQLDQQAKDKLNKDYEKDAAEYLKQKAEFNASLTEEQKNDIKKLDYEMSVAKEKKKLKAEIKESGKPKRPMSSYLLFCQTEKDSIATLGLIEYQLKMKEKWYNLPKDQKEKWEKKAEDLKKAYTKELTAWEEKMIKIGNLDFVRNRTLEQKKKLTPTSNKGRSA